MDITYHYADGNTEVWEDYSWCREVISTNIVAMVTHSETPILSVEATGVASGRGSYRPAYVSPSFLPLKLPATLVNVLTLLLEMTADMGTVVLGGRDKLLLSKATWIDFWEVGTPVGWDRVNISGEDGGSICVPSILMSNIPMTSFILYLPRIWYNLTKMKWTYRKLPQKYFRRGTYGCGAYGCYLLAQVASVLAEPTFTMPHGGAEFWTFLQYLIVASRPTALREFINHSDEGINGFESWAEFLWAQKAWEPYNRLCKDMREYGSHALVKDYRAKGCL